MSTTIDQKVVEMQFDNAQFEGNVQTSLSTLDKLKKALHFEEAADGLDAIGKSVSNIQFDDMANGLDNVGSHFSALDAIAFGFFSKIGGMAADFASKLTNMATSMTAIQQAGEGWNKYADKTTSVQTIMAATAKDIGTKFADEGEQMEYVNEQLNKLNWFSDETSYSLTDMTNNVGKFTSNGVELETAATAMQGIATWAAISGQNTQSASRAMYNMAQALSTGSVKLIDWKSIENANMATVEFKQTAIDTAVELGTLTKVGEGLYKTLDGHDVSLTNFNEGLKDAWFNSDVLLKSLNKYGGFANSLNSAYNETGLLTSQLIDYTKKYKEGHLDLGLVLKKTDSEFRNQAGSAERLKEIFDELSSDEFTLGRKAFAAAQEAKTFQEAIDATKDAVSTGWMNTFELIFGNYLEAKEVWTGLANALYDVFAASGEVRNGILEYWNDLGGRTSLIQGISNVWAGLTGIFERFTSKILPNFEDNEVLRYFGEKLANGTKAFESYTEKFKNMFGILDDEEEEAAEGAGEVAEAVSDASGSVVSDLEEIEGVAQAIIRGDFGNGQERINALMEKYGSWATYQNKVNEILGDTTRYEDDLVIATDNLTGSTGEVTEETKEFAKALVPPMTPAEKLEAIAGGLGSALRLLGGALKAVWKGVKPVLATAGRLILTIVDIVGTALAHIGLAITDVEDGVNKASEPFRNLSKTVFQFFLPLRTLLEKATTGIRNFAVSVGEFISDFRVTDGFRKLGDSLSRVWGIIKDFASGIFDRLTRGANDFIGSFHIALPTLEQVVDFFDRAASGLADFLDRLFNFGAAKRTFQNVGGGIAGVLAVVSGKLQEVGGGIADAFTALTGIDISGITSKIGAAFSWLTGGLVNIAKTIGSKVSFKDIFTSLSDAFIGIGENASGAFGKIKEFFVNVGQAGSDKLTAVLDGIKKAFEWIKDNVGHAGTGIQDFFSKIDLSKVSDAFGKIGGGNGNPEDSPFAKAWKWLQDNVFTAKGAATALGGTGIISFIANTIADFILKLRAGGVAKSLSKTLDATTAAIKEFAGVEEEGIADKIKKVAQALLIVAAAVAVIAFTEWATGGLWNAVAALSVLILVMSLLFAALAQIDFGEGGATLDKSGLHVKMDGLSSAMTGLVKLSAALLIAAFAIERLADIDPNDVTRGGVVAGIISLVLTGIVGALGFLNSKGWVNFDGVSKAALAMVGISVALMLAARSIERLGSMDPKQLEQGGWAVGLLAIAFGAAAGMAQSTIAGAAAFMIMAMAIGRLIPVITLFAVAPWPMVAKGVGVLGALMLAMGLAALMAQSSIGGALAFITLAFALNMLIPAIALLGNMDTGQLIQGGIAIGLLAVALGAAAGLAKGTLGGALAIIAMAVALNLLLIPLNAIADLVDKGIFWSAYLGLAALLGLFVGIAAIMGIFSEVFAAGVGLMFTMAGAIAVLGAALLALGVGLLIFATVGVPGALGFAAAIVIIATAIATAIPILLTGIVTGIVAAISTLYLYMPVVREALAGILKELGLLIVDLVGSFFHWFFVDFLWGTICLQFLPWLGSHIASLLGALGGILGKFFSWVGSTAGKFFGGIWQRLVGFFTGICKAAANFVNSAFELIKNAFTSVFKATGSFGSGIFKFIGEVLTRIFGAVGGFFGGIFDWLGKALGSIGQLLFGAVSEIGNKIGGFISGIGNWFKEKLFNDGKKGGENLAAGTTAGIEGNEEATYKATEDFSNNVNDRFEFDFADKTGDEMFDVKSILNDAKDSIPMDLGQIGLDGSDSYDQYFNITDPTAFEINGATDLMANMPEEAREYMEQAGINFSTSYKEGVNSDQTPEETTEEAVDAAEKKMETFGDNTADAAKTAATRIKNNYYDGLMDENGNSHVMWTSTGEAWAKTLEETRKGGDDVAEASGDAGEKASKEFIEKYKKTEEDTDTIAGRIKEKLTTTQTEVQRIGEDTGRVYYAGAFTDDETQRVVANASGMMADKGAKGITDEKGEFVTAGENVVYGYTDGIYGKWSHAYAAGAYIARQTLHAMQKTLDEHSPSKETMQIGVYAVEGLAKGLYKLAGLAYDSGAEVGSQALDGVAEAIRNISDNIDEEVDPVIRPVLDLSDITKGTATIDDMLSQNRSMQLAGNAALDRASFSTLQNGVENELLSSMKKLTAAISGGGNTINVYAQPGMDVKQLADEVQKRLTQLENQRRAVFA